MTGPRVEGILRSLASGQADTAWAQFLESYSDLLRHVIRQYEDDRVRSEDCFDFVCARLTDDGFRRLTSFTPHGVATFRTWLTAVTANLCIDWRRSMYGRFRMPSVLRDLPEIDRMVFECFYRQGMTHQECLFVLGVRYPKITVTQLCEINGRLQKALQPKQRWALSRSRTHSAGIELSDDALSAEDGDPAILVEAEQDRDRVRKALSRLDPDHRVCLQLRYQQDLTLDEVARLMGFKDPFEARRKVEAALAEFAKILKS